MRRPPKQVLVNPASKKDLAFALGTIFDHTFKEGLHRRKSDPTRSTFLRVSSFPFCGRQWALSLKNQYAQYVFQETASAYFTSVGTTVHEVFQEAMEFLAAPEAKSDWGKDEFYAKAVIVQNWKCTDCGHVHKFVPHPSACEWCGASGHTIIGKEHQVRWGKFVLGHMDGTLAFPHQAGEPYSKLWHHIPYDFKTTTKSAIEGSALPYEDNVSQLTAYGEIKRNDGYNVPAVCLTYISRDNPSLRKNCVVPLLGKRTAKEMKTYEKHYRWARNATQADSATVEQVMALPPVVESDFEAKCKYCKFTKICQASSQGNDKPLKLQATDVVKFLRKGGQRWAFPND